MKLLAYAIFAVCVLLVSGFARAAAALPMTMPFAQVSSYQTPVHIENVNVQGAPKQLTISTRLPNPCMQQPAASLTAEAKNPTVLTLRLTSPLYTDACITKVQYYDTQLELPILVQASQLQIDPKTVYTIRTEGYDFEMQVLGSDLTL